MKKTILVVGVVVIVAGIIVFFLSNKSTQEVNLKNTETTNEPAETSSMKNYVGANFSLAYPSGWVEQNNGTTNYFIAPQQQGFSANISVGEISSADNSTVEDIATSAKKLQEKDYSNFMIISEKSLILDGYPAYQRVYSWRDVEHSADITQIQTWIKTANKLYLFTASSLSELFPVYQNKFLTTISSFKSN